MYFQARVRGFFFSSRRRHTRYWRDWSSDVCSSDLRRLGSRRRRRQEVAVALREAAGPPEHGQVRAPGGRLPPCTRRGLHRPGPAPGSRGLRLLLSCRRPWRPCWLPGATTPIPGARAPAVGHSRQVSGPRWLRQDKREMTARRYQATAGWRARGVTRRSEEHTSELQSRQYLVCRLLLEKKKKCS